MDLTIADCTAEQTDDLRQFLANSYGANYILLRDPAFMHWQYAAGSDGGWCFKVAKLDGEIIGTLGYIRTILGTPDQKLNAAWACNWIINESYRSYGLGALLLREMMLDADVSLSSGIKPGIPLATMIGLGWRDCGYAPRLVAAINRDRLAGLSQTGLLDITSTRVPSAMPQEVALVDRFSADAGDLWLETIGKSAAGNVRSTSYLNHRYSNHPTFSYRLFEGRYAGRLQSLAVYRVECASGLPGTPIKLGRLVEFIASPAYFTEMAMSILFDAAALGCDGIDFFCFHRETCNQLIQNGFTQLTDTDTEQLASLLQPVSWNKTGINLAVYPATILERIPIRDWYVTKSDNDQDRPN